MLVRPGSPASVNERDRPSAPTIRRVVLMTAHLSTDPRRCRLVRRVVQTDALLGLCQCRLQITKSRFELGGTTATRCVGSGELCAGRIFATRTQEMICFDSERET